jgi:hypothetical protein
MFLHCLLSSTHSNSDRSAPLRVGFLCELADDSLCSSDGFRFSPAGAANQSVSQPNERSFVGSRSLRVRLRGLRMTGGARHRGDSLPVDALAVPMLG